MQAATYGPQVGGPGYLIAPFKGQNADILTHVVLQAEMQPDIPHDQVQAIIWAVSLKHYDYIVRNPYSARLLKPEHLAMMRARQEGQERTSAFVDLALGQIPSELKEAYELQKAFAGAFDAFTRGDMTYADLVRVAVLNGDPPTAKSDREIPAGRWQVAPGGYFVRCGNERFDKGVVEFYRPHSFDAEYDRLERPVRVVNKDTGFRVDFTYFDDLHAVPHPLYPLIKAYPFKKIVISVPGALLPDGKAGKLEILNKGYILAGPIASPKRSASRSSEEFPWREVAVGDDSELDRAVDFVTRQLKDAGDQSIRQYSRQYDDAMSVKEKYEKVRSIWDIREKLKDPNVSRLDKVRALQDAIDLIPGTEHLGIPKDLFKKTIGRQIDIAESVIAELGGEDEEDVGDKKKGPRIRKAGLGVSGNPHCQRTGPFPY